MHKTVILLLLTSLICGWARTALAGPFDPAPVWPLCGRISEKPPSGWQAPMGCPENRWGSSRHTDLPLVANFGPRLLAHENYRYDFHRGIDIKTAYGSPVFAMAPGQVIIAGHDDSYDDGMVQIQHNRPGSLACAGGCYYSNYIHLSQWVVEAGQSVKTGQLIGYSGENKAGYPHLHFEIREAPADNPQSSWQRYAIHPLNVLPYDRCKRSRSKIRIRKADFRNKARPRVRVEFRQHKSDPQLLVRRFDVEILEIGENGGYVVQQSGSMPNPDGYHLNPNWIDFDIWNREYTHMDSPANPWEDFEDCPHAREHGERYDPNVHLDKPKTANRKVGSFNGISIRPSVYDNSRRKYRLRLAFDGLSGIESAERVCVIAHATLLNGQMLHHSKGCDWRRWSQICNAECQAELDAKQARCSSL